MRIVQKYGGSSVATIEHIQNIAKHIKELKEEENEIVVVASAMGKTTDELIRFAKEACENPNKRELDALLSTGEIKTVTILSIVLTSMGVDSVSLTGFQAGFKTSSDYSKAFIFNCDVSRIEEELKKGKVVVVAGFQGMAENGDITTFGRGGSDTTAVALAASLNCVCEIYTDVESVCCVDPRVYEKTRKLHNISYEEMMESAVCGAKVLDARCVELAKKYKVNLYLGKTLEKDKNKGTFVMDKLGFFEEMPITNLAIKDVCVVSVIYENKNYTNEIFNLLVKHKINYEMIGLKEIKNKLIFTFGVALAECENILSELKNLFNRCDIETLKGVKLTLVGLGLATHTRIAESVFDLLSKNNISFRDISISEISISMVVGVGDKEKAIDLLAKKFNLCD